MGARTIVLLSALLALCATTCGGDDEGAICTADELTTALAAAHAGDTVTIGACRIVGSFTVPTGVTLAGKGTEQSTVETQAPQPALRLPTGTPPTQLRDLAVRSAGNTGILVRNPGEAVLERVLVRATREIAIGVEDVAAVTLRNVTLQGTVTADNANRILGGVTGVDGNVWPTHGLVIVNVPRVEMTNVTASGFAGIGVLLVNSTTTWSGGGAPANLGTGLMVHGGSARLTGLDLSRMLGGLLLLPSYAAVFAAGADVQTERLVASNGEDYGLLHDHSTGRHVDLVARGNGNGAAWMQYCDGVELSGTGMELSANHFAAVVAMESSNVTVADGRIDDTVMATRFFTETGTVLVGDGLQIVRATGPTTVRNLSLSGNNRVGLLLDLGGATLDGFDITGVVVDGAGTQFGAIAQHGSVTTTGWDSGIARHGDTVANDADPPASLPIVGRVDEVDIPAGAGVADSGLVEIVNPDPPP